MSRIGWLLSGLAMLLVIVLFWLLWWSPRDEELVRLDTEIEEAQAQQTETQGEITSLREVREDAPDVQSLITASDAIVPNSPSLPAALRQLQLAGEESGLTLRSVSPGRPQALTDEAEGEAPVEGEEPTEGAPELEEGTQLASIEISVVVEGSYFQIVDFLRRVEDPEISPRGVIWTQVATSPLEYPELTATLNGQMYAVLPAGIEAEDEAEPDTGESADEDAAGEDADDADEEDAGDEEVDDGEGDAEDPAAGDDDADDGGADAGGDAEDDDGDIDEPAPAASGSGEVDP